MKSLFIGESDIIYFNTDHIEVFGTFKNYQEYFLGMDGDNSHIREFKGYTLEKTDKIRNYQYKITFWRDNIPAFAWYRGDQLNEYIETRDYFVAYGSAFQKHSLQEIITFINENIHLDYKDMKLQKKSHTVKRIDLALDIRKNILDLIPYFKKLKQKGSQFFGENGNLQTYYIGEKKNTFNKALLIRMYDKIADIYQKEKQRYYPGYLKEDSVTRVELEFRSDLLKEVEIVNFLDKDFCLGLFQLYIGKHTEIFKSFTVEGLVKLDRLKKKVNLEDLRHRQITRKRYLNTFLGYAKKFLYLDGCPIDVLMREGVYKKETILDIMLACDSGGFDIDIYTKGVTIKNSKLLFSEDAEEKEDEEDKG